jgi:hypothetical protein
VPDYVAPLLTLALAILGFFFAREGEDKRLSSLGYVILGLTVASGVFAAYDADQKSKSADEQKATIARLQRDARRINNLNIATMIGVNRTFEIVRLFGTQEYTDTQSKEAHEKDLGRTLQAYEFVPESIMADFLSGLISKRDLGQTVAIDANLLGYEIKLRLKPKSDGAFAVTQTVQDTTKTYDCGRECPGQDTPSSSKPRKLDSTNILFLEALASESSYGLELSDGSSVGKVISALQSSEGAFLTIKASFKVKDEYEKFNRIVQATKFTLKFYGSGVKSRKAECFVALTAPITSEVRSSPSDLTTEIKLTGFDSMDINLCETAP